MGKRYSKPPVKPPKEGSSKQVDEYEDVELVLLREAIERDPKSFILNNLMMCIQFFENYEEDIIQIKETLASSYEAKLNKRLPPQKHVLLPDILQEYIAHNIIFTSQRQTGDLIIESLQPIRLYVVYNNIEITEHHYQPEYSSLNNGITYNLMVQPSEHPGYVRLQRLDETPYPRNLSKQEEIDLSLIEDDDEIYDNDGESIYSRNSNMILPHQRKKIRSQLQSTIVNIGSLSNIHDDKIYGDQVSPLRKNIYKTQSNYDIKTKSDCEHMFSVENYDKKTSKSELDIRNESYQQQLPRPDTVKSTKPKVDERHHRRPPSISSSGYRSGAYDSDSDWRDYYTVTPSAQTSNIHKNDKMDASSKIDSNATIPTQCFKKVRINNKGKIYAMRAERKQLQNNKQIRLKMADRQYDCEVFYMNNEIFMRHFADLFICQLVEPLGFKPEDLNCVTNSAIHCDKMIESHSFRLYGFDSYEITPTIWLQWPTYAQEWLDRPRSTWPDYNDISKVKDFGCYVIPEGFLPQQRDLPSRKLRHQNVKRNIQQEIEWRLTFPAAERYLETCMTRSQVQVYLIALMLHKTFLRPVSDSTPGLTTSHIRNKLFWLIEEDDRPSKWPDNRTGECLIKLLNSLYRCISQNGSILPDYFLRDRNMFSEVSFECLLRSQKQLKRIIDNPVMFVFHAMRNIKHSNQFFPRLDFAMLLKILTVQPWLAVVNPTLDMPRTTEESHREEIYNRSGGLWDTARMNDQNYSTRVITNRTLITQRKATDLVVEIEECCAKLEGLRLAALLDFFINHFIRMAECCHKYRSYQKKVYLDQADRLSIILSDKTRYKDDAKAYRDKIYALRMRVATNSTRLPNEPPETPKRNGDSIFVGTLKNRYTQQFAEQTVPMQPKGKQSQSSPEYMSKTTKAITHEIRFKDEKYAEKKVNAISNDEDSYTRNVSKSQSDESASGTIQKVISLADHLSEATYI